MTGSQAVTGSAPASVDYPPSGGGHPGRDHSGKPRLLFAINSLAGGGAERVFTSLVAASARYRSTYEMAVVLLDEDEPKYALPDWIQVYRLDCRGSFLRSVLRMNRLVGSYRPELALSFLTRANLAAGLSMAVRRKPFIVSERTNTNAQLAKGAAPSVSRRLVRLVYPRARRVIAVSQGVAATLQADYRVQQDQVDVINNPVDIAHVQSLAAQPPGCPVGPDDIVAMGRLCPEKNFELAIRGFARSNWPGRLIILGEGPQLAQLQAIGRELGLNERLVFPGFLANPYAVIKRACVFMLTSNHEGFSNSLLEAMSLEVPVLATDCPFSPAEILSAGSPPAGGAVRGTGGLLIRTGDEDGLANALRMLRSVEMRSELRSEGRGRVSGFDPARIMERYWRVIDRVADEAGLVKESLAQQLPSAGAS